MDTIINLTPPIDGVQYGISDEYGTAETEGFYLNPRYGVTPCSSVLDTHGSIKKILCSTNPKDTRFPYLVMPSKEQEVERLALEYTNATRERRALYGTVYSAFKTGFNANPAKFTQEDIKKAFNAGGGFGAIAGHWTADKYIQSLQPTAKAVRVEMKEILATAGEYEEAGTVRIGYEIKLEKSKEHPQGVIKALEVIY